MKNITPERIKNLFLRSIDKLLDDRELYLADPEKSFSRTRKISFRDTMLFPVVSSEGSTSIEMLDYFPQSRLPSQAALNYRRGQVKPLAFKKLLTAFSSQLPQQRSFHGMRLIACDGTRINTPYNPHDASSFVSCIEGRKGFNQYHLNTFYDVLNDLYLDACIQGYFSMNEKQAFCEMIDRFPAGIPAVFIADRGYASFNVIAHAIKNNHHFVIRLTSSMALNLFCDTDAVRELDSFDIEDDVHIGRARTRGSKELRNYHLIRSDKTYDFIPRGSGQIDCFRLRLVKFTLRGGDSEYLLTDLTQQELSSSDLQEVYRLRWGIETSYRFLKYASGLKHMHSLKQEFIFQEIYAKLICYDFCAAVMGCHHDGPAAHAKHEYVTERNYLIKVCIRYLKGRLHDIQELITKRKVPVRAGRSFKRNMRRQHADTLQYR